MAPGATGAMSDSTTETMPPMPPTPTTPTTPTSGRGHGVRGEADGGILSGRTVLVTGVLRPGSIAAAVAGTAQDQGARVVLTAPGRVLPLTRRVAAELGLPDPVLPLDLTDADDVDGLVARLRDLGVDRLDGVVHAVAHMEREGFGTLLPEEPVGDEDAGEAAAGSEVREGAGATVGTRGRGDDVPPPLPGPGGVPAAQVAQALSVSATSLATLVAAVVPLLGAGSAVVGLSFDSERVWPGYGWMGPVKAALEATARGLAVELGPSGIRVNLVSAGPLRTPAASVIPGFGQLVGRWQELAPLGWEAHDAAGVARTVVAALSDWLPVTTGAVLRADGGAGLRALVP